MTYNPGFRMTMARPDLKLIECLWVVLELTLLSAWLLHKKKIHFLMEINNITTFISIKRRIIFWTRPCIDNTASHSINYGL